MAVQQTANLNSSPRLVNVVLAVWLFISAFLWPHTAVQMTNTWIVGVLCLALALLSATIPWARYVSAALAIWLFISAWALPTLNIGTIWNNALVGIAIFIVSLVPGPVGRPGGFPAPPTHA